MSVKSSSLGRMSRFCLFRVVAASSCVEQYQTLFFHIFFAVFSIQHRHVNHCMAASGFVGTVVIVEGMAMSEELALAHSPATSHC